MISIIDYDPLNKMKIYEYTLIHLSRKRERENGMAKLVLTTESQLIKKEYLRKSSTDAKTSRLKFNEEPDINVVSKYLPRNYLRFPK